MLWSKTFLYFFTFGVGLLFFLFMVKRLRYFESTKYFFYLLVCLYLVIIDVDKNKFTALPCFSTLLELYNTPYFIAFLGVLLRFYLKKMIYPVKSFSLKNLKHFIFPSIVIIVDRLVQNFLIDENILIVNYRLHIPANSSNSFSILLFINGFSYVLTSLIFILRFSNKQSTVFKRINKKTLIWLKFVIIIIAFFMILELLLFLKKDQVSPIPIVLGKYILINALIFYILFSPSTVKKMRGCVYVISEINDTNESFLLPRAHRGTTYDYWHTIIEDYISFKMPYLNMNFNVNEMASDLTISKQKLVLILTYVYKMDFMEFVNRYRVYYFLELCNDKSFNSLQIEDQIIRVGFYNKSDFYYYFRKYMNSSPPLNINEDRYVMKREIQ